MAVSNRNLRGMSDLNKDAYLRLRKALDSLSDVALTEFDLFDSKEERSEIADFVHEKVKGMLNEIALTRQTGWHRINIERAERLEEHAVNLRGRAQAAVARGGVAPKSDSPEFEGCPPGYQLIDGICVPI